MRGDLETIKQGLKDRIEDLCTKLLPDGRPEGRLWVAHNPVTLDHHKSPEFKVALNRDIGAWKDWRTGEKGDVIGLVEYVMQTDFKGALSWSRDFLGLRSMSRQELEAMRFAAEASRKKAERKQIEDRSAKLVRADRLFNEDTVKLGEGSQAEALARAYFSARAMPLEEIRNLSAYAFRFSGATEWWRGAQYRTEGKRRVKVTPGPLFPAIHSGMRQRTGIVTACHVTFLDPTRPAKAPVKQPKLMYGEASGAVIEIACGPTGKPYWMTGDVSDLVLGEGIETGGSLAVELSAEARIWAAGSIDNLGNAPIDLACIDRVFLARDRNDGNPQAQRQLDRALEKLEQWGKPLTVMAPHFGDDFNDVAQGDL